MEFLGGRGKRRAPPPPKDLPQLFNPLYPKSIMLNSLLITHHLTTLPFFLPFSNPSTHSPPLPQSPNLPPLNPLTHRPHRHLHHNERPRTNRQRPHTRRPNPPPKPPHPLLPPRLRETIPHVPIPHHLALSLRLLVQLTAQTLHPVTTRNCRRCGWRGDEPVTLHLALDDVERVRGKPEGFTGKTAVERDERGGDGGPRGGGSLRVQPHQVFERQKPEFWEIKENVKRKKSTQARTENILTRHRKPSLLSPPSLLGLYTAHLFLPLGSQASSYNRQGRCIIFLLHAVASVT